MVRFKKILLFSIGIILVFFVWFFISGKKSEQQNNGPVQLQMVPEGPVPSRPEENNNLPAVSDNQTVKNLPSQALLNVPFLVQAPFGIWDSLHEDACEEASLIMVKHFLAGDKNISPTAGDVEIRKMIGYEEKNGYGSSVSMEQLAQIAKDFSDMQNSRIKTNATTDDIKKELAAGHPVIVPAAGKILPNPNFRNGGPLYHMLVVVGYDKNGFITNDPGTKKGQGFRYSFNDLFYAIHDWNNGDVLNGQKTYLVFD